MIKVTREEARFMLIQVGIECERFDRWRNYEIERLLDEIAGVDTSIDDYEHLHVIAEWCPFNGIYCAWREQAPSEVIERAIKEVEEERAVWLADRATGSSKYPDPDRHIAYLRAALADRT